MAEVSSYHQLGLNANKDVTSVPPAYHTKSSAHIVVKNICGWLGTVAPLCASCAELTRLVNTTIAIVC